MAPATTDPFVQFKAGQREGWSLFSPMEIFTAMPAANLVRFAEVGRGQRVLDVACGTGVVAVTAARAGGKVRGLDLSPVLLDRARQNAAIAGVDIELTEGDAEALPYPDGSFDVVLSQFGHIFAPRPPVVVAEMLRVLRPGGRIAFSTWPPELGVGRQFALLRRYMPPPAGEPPAPPELWGDPNVVRERLGGAVSDLLFERATAFMPTLSPQHTRTFHETAIAPLAKAVAGLQAEPAKLAQLRAEYEALIAETFEGNSLRQHFMMTRATKKV
jgi:SAM-dependent methyltransferase